MRTVIEMKTFSVILSSICVGIVFAQSVTDEVCKSNHGNDRMFGAFRYESDYYFFAEGLKAFKVSGVWDSAKKSMDFRTFEWLNASQWTDTDNLRLITTVDYPGKGKRVLRMDRAQVCAVLLLIRS